MRVGLVAQWLRAGLEDPVSRRTAFRYALGISIRQIGWIARLVLAETGVLPDASLLPVFIGLVACELAVPRWAEKARPTSWHPHHIAERYGLFTIILVGESVLAASTGVQAASAAGAGVNRSFVTIALGGLTSTSTPISSTRSSPPMSTRHDRRHGRDAATVERCRVQRAIRPAGLEDAPVLVPALTEDKAIQRRSSGSWLSARARGSRRIQKVSASHASMVSQPEAATEIILQAAEAAAPATA